MKTKIIVPVIAAALLSTLSACSYVKSLFPDKEKDYQYTTEIPPLILPPDLKVSSVPGLPTPSAAPDANASYAGPSATVNARVEQAAAPTVKKPAATSAMPVEDVAGSDSEPELPNQAVTVDRVKFDNGENRLRINVPFTRAWRIMGKALSRKALEVTARNQEAGLFTVQYDPDEHTAKDSSYWNEFTSMFTETESNEKTYLLKLEKNNQQTDIVVVDKDQQPLLDAASFKLLTLLQETIKADLAQK